jgi:hypothetical protein
MSPGYIFHFVTSSNSNYCSRACSAQASASTKALGLCKVRLLSVSLSDQLQTFRLLGPQQCQQKPTFPNFDFCGKHCASLWQANHPDANAGPTTQSNKPSSGLLNFKNASIPFLRKSGELTRPSGSPMSYSETGIKHNHNRTNSCLCHKYRPLSPGVLLPIISKLLLFQMLTRAQRWRHP